MSDNLERLWFFIVGERFILTVSGQANAAINGLTPCSGALDIFTGCGTTIASLVANFIVGTIHGAPAIVNLLLGVLVNGAFVIALLKLGRGVPT